MSENRRTPQDALVTTAGHPDQYIFTIVSCGVLQFSDIKIAYHLTDVKYA